MKQEPSKGTSDSNRDEEKEELELLVENLSKEIIFLENQNKTLQYKYVCFNMLLVSHCFQCKNLCGDEFF